MERVAVRSTEIAIVGYEASTKLLEVAFRNGSVYHYDQVPPEVYRQMIDAPSVGIFFAEHVKTTYAYTKVH
jgi:hypothetical protein